MARERNIRFRITSTADARAIQNLNKELISLRNTMNNLSKGQKKSLDKALGLDSVEREGAAAINTLRNFAKEAGLVNNAAKRAGKSVDEMGEKNQKAAREAEKLAKAEFEKARAARQSDAAFAKLSGTTSNYENDMKGLQKALRSSKSALGDMESSLTKHLSGALRNGSRDVETIMTDLRLLRSETGKVDKAMQGMKTLPDEVARAEKRLATATQDVAEAQRKLYAAQRNPKRTTEDIDEARRALDRSNASYNEAEREINSVNRRFEQFGTTINEAERRLTKLQNAIKRNNLEDFLPKGASQKLQSLSDALVSSSRGMEKFGGAASKELRGFQQLLGGLSGRRTQLTTIADDLESIRKEMVAMGKVETGWLRDIMGNTTSATKQATQSLEAQSRVTIKLASDMTRLVNSTTKFGDAQRETARAVAAGTHGLREQQRLNQLYGSALAEARTSDRSFRNRDVQLREDKEKLIATQNQLNEKLNASRAILSRVGAAGTAAYADAEKDVERLTAALRINNAALDKNEQNFRENTAAMDQAGAEMREMESQQKGMITLFTRMRTEQEEQARAAKKAADESARAAREQASAVKKAADEAAREETKRVRSMGNLSRIAYGAFGSGAGPGGPVVPPGTINVFREMAAIIQQVTRVAMQMATTFGNVLSGAIRSAATAARGFVNSAGSMFSGLQRSLQGISNQFRNFGQTVVRSMQTARTSMMEFYAAGYSLMTIGSQIQQFGNTMWRGMGRGLEGFVEYEKARTQAGIAGAQPIGANGQIAATGETVARYQINSGIIDDIIFDLQRGIATPEWLGGGGRPLPVQFDAKELAQGLYYYSSAIGAPITESNRNEVSDAVATIMQMASITNTGIETATKGVLNVMMEFGFDPRAIGSPDRATREQASRDTAQVAAQMGYLANISSMEVSDIVETFKMVGPQAHLLSPGALGEDGAAGSGLNETFMLAFLASEVGLRGGNVGRGITQAFTSLLDPTAKMLEIAGKYWGEDGEALTTEEFNRIFKEDGALKGGIQGFLTQLSGTVERQDLTTMLAELFTSNATRALTGPVVMSEDFDMESWLKDIEDNPLKWMEAAVAESANTITGWFTFMKNGWFQFQNAIIGSISGQLMNGFRLIGEVLFEVAERIKQFPALGRGIATVVGAIASLASVLGTLMVGAGAILLVGRSFGMLGGMVLPVIRIILMAVATIFTLLPILALVAVAVGLLTAAYKANAFGLADFVDKVQYAFNNFDDVIMPIIDNIFNGLGKLGFAFMEFVNGILLGQGPLDNLGTLLKTVFGSIIGGAFFSGLLRLRDSLDGTRESVKAFMSRDTFDSNVLVDAGLAVRGFFESLIVGTQDYDSFSAANRIGDMLGIENLGTKLQSAARDFNRFIMTMVAIARQVGGVWMDLSNQIRENLVRALTGGDVSGVFQSLVTLAQSVAAGIISAFTIILGAINNVVSAVADISVALNSAGDEGREFLGFTFTLNEALRAIGMTIGLYLGTRMALMFTPLGAIITRVIPLVTSLGAAIIGVGGRFVVFGAQVAISLAQATAQVVIFIGRIIALSIIQGIGSMISTSFNMIAGSAGAASVFVQILGLAFSGLQLAMLGVVGLGFAVAAGLYLIIGATQGFDAANAAARAFFQGFMDGISALIIVGSIVAKVVTEVVQFIGRLTGLNKAFGDLTTAARMFGLALGLLFTGAVLSSLIGFIGTMITGIMGIGAAMGGLTLASVATWGGMALLILAVAPHLDVIVSKIAELVDWLNQAQIAGVGLGDVLMGLGGAAVATGGGRGMLARGARWAAPAVRAGMSNPYVMTASALAIAGYQGWQEYNEPEVQYEADVVEPYLQAVNNPGLDQSKIIGDLQQQAGIQFDPVAQTYRNMGWSEEQIRVIYEGQDGTGGYRAGYVNQNMPAGPENPENVLAKRQIDYYNKYGFLPGDLPTFEEASEGQRETGYYLTKPAQANIAADNAAYTVRNSVMSAFGMKPDKTGGQDAQDYGGGFIDALKDIGVYEHFDGLADMMGFDLENMSMKDIGEIKNTYLAAGGDLSGMDWSWMGPQGEAYGEAMDNWETYQTILKQVGGNVEQARAIFKENMGFDAPIAAPKWEDYLGSDDLASEADRLAEAAAKIGLSVDDINNAFASLKGMSTEAFLNAQSPTGLSMGGVLAGGVGETILGNIPEGTAPWMNKTELLYDAAGTGVNLGAPVGGQNMHKALSPYLEIVASQTGLTVDELLVDVPKFYAPEEFVGVASADIALALSEGLTQGEYLSLDLLGADAGIKGYEAGMNWAELTDYAVGQAVSGHEWNLTDFLVESWGYTVDQANEYLASHGIDPNAISSSIMEATEIATLTGNGAFNAMTTEMYDYLAAATNDFTSNVITMTQEEWDKIPPAYKAVMANLGITTIISDFIPAEALAGARAKVEEFGEIVRALPTYIAEGMEGVANYQMDGSPRDWLKVGEFEDAAGELMVVLQDVDGTQVYIPAADYEPFVGSLDIARQAAEEFKAYLENYQISKGYTDDYGYGDTIDQDFKLPSMQGDIGSGGPSNVTGLSALGLPDHVDIKVNIESSSLEAATKQVEEITKIKDVGDLTIKISANTSNLTESATALKTMREAIEKMGEDSQTFTITAETSNITEAAEGLTKIQKAMNNIGQNESFSITANTSNLTETADALKKMGDAMKGLSDKSFAITADTANLSEASDALTKMKDAMTLLGDGKTFTITAATTNLSEANAALESIYTKVNELGGGISFQVTASTSNLSETRDALTEIVNLVSTSTETPGVIYVRAETSNLSETESALYNIKTYLSETQSVSGTITIAADTSGLTEAKDALLTFKEAAGTGLHVNLTTQGFSEAASAAGNVLGIAKLLAVTWTVTLAQTGAAETSAYIQSVADEALLMAVTYTLTIAQTGADTVINKINEVKNAAEDMSGTYTATVNIVVTGLATLTTAINAINNLPTSKTSTVTINNVTNNVVNTTRNNGVVNTAVGGIIGSAAMLGRSHDPRALVPRARGGFVAAGEYTLVGELGPELVKLPMGSEVFTARESEQMLTRSLTNGPRIGSETGSMNHVTINNNGETHTGDTFNFHGPINIGSNLDAKAFFAEIDRRAGRKTQLARRGMVPADDMKPW